MTPQTPAVGQPLDAESVRLLVKGDWLTGPDGGLWRYGRPYEAIDYHDRNGAYLFQANGAEVLVKDGGGKASRWFMNLTFLGRPDQEDWIKHHAFDTPPPDDLMVEYITGSGLTSARMRVIELRWDRDFKWRPAPHAPSSAREALIRRMAYGYAVMHKAICHMAGTSGASGRWYYDKASEAFSRVSPIHSITESSNPFVNGDYFSGLSEFLAALASPTQDGPRFTSVDGAWKDQRLSRLERVKAHRLQFGSELKAAVEAVDEESGRQAIANAAQDEPLGVDLEELKRLAEAATNGPWRRDENSVWGACDPYDNSSRGMGVPIVDCRSEQPRWAVEPLDYEKSERNAAYIAAANPAVILKLIAEIERRGRK